MSPNLKINIFFLILDSKDIKDKQLTVNFNTLNSTILQSNILQLTFRCFITIQILDNKKQNNILVQPLCNTFRYGNPNAIILRF